MELAEVLSSISESLHEERVRAGLTLEQLALRADLSTAHLSRLESGDRQPSIAALIGLSRALGISMSALLGEGKGESAIRLYTDHEPTHLANGLMVSACSGFPGSSTLDALRITIEPDRVPPPFARHRGEEWIHVLVGRLRLEFEEDTHSVPAGGTRTSTPPCPTGWARKASRPSSWWWRSTRPPTFAAARCSRRRILPTSFRATNWRNHRDRAL